MKKQIAIFLQVLVVIIGLGAGALLLWEPRIEGRNVHATLSETYFGDPFLAFVYLGSIPFFVALYQVFKLIGYVGKNNSYSRKTIKSLRVVRCCALTIIGFVVAGEIYILLNHGDDDPAGGLFVGSLIALGAGVVALVSTFLERFFQKELEFDESEPL